MDEMISMAVKELVRALIAQANIGDLARMSAAAASMNLDLVGVFLHIRVQPSAVFDVPDEAAVANLENALPAVLTAIGIEVSGVVIVFESMV